ncbi:MAG: FHA domain-containing protein [Ruminococcus sp.]|nr:FHA domain-containing protein [Ruminococcus sp.]
MFDSFSWDSMTEILQDSTLFSIFVSAVVVLMIVFSIITVYSKAREEKRVEEMRWSKVSSNMALYDTSRHIIIPLEADEILVGRHGSADIWLSDMSVSRYHAVLYVSNGIWSVMDLDSKSGTYVNGRKIRSVVQLRDMDEIRFGNKAVIIRQRRR